MQLFELQKRLQTFDLRNELVKSVEDTKEDIVSLNQAQLFIGVNNEGEPIRNTKNNGTSYSFQWGQFRQSLGLQTDHYDLKVTGTFWESIKVDVTNNLFVISSTDPKYTSIRGLFADQLLGLNQESTYEKYVPKYLLPALKRRIESELKLTFS